MYSSQRMCAILTGIKKKIAATKYAERMDAERGWK